MNLYCRQSMQCEFVSIERQGNVLSFRTLFFLGKPCGYMVFMMNNARENRLCNRKIWWRHWKSTSRKCLLFYTYLKSYNNVHGNSISYQHYTCIVLILVTQTGWWILHPGHPGWSPRQGIPVLQGRVNHSFVIFLLYFSLHFYIFALRAKYEK